MRLYEILRLPLSSQNSIPGQESVVPAETPSVTFHEAANLLKLPHHCCKNWYKSKFSISPSNHMRMGKRNISTIILSYEVKVTETRVFESSINSTMLCTYISFK